MLNDRSTVHEFINLSKLLGFPGELTENTSMGMKSSASSSRNGHVDAARYF